MRAPWQAWLARVLALAIGFGVARLLSSPPQPSAPEPVARQINETPGEPVPAPPDLGAKALPTKSGGDHLLDRLATASAEDFASLWKEFVTGPDERMAGDGLLFSSLVNRQWLLQRWLQLDPEAALAQVVDDISRDIPMASRSARALLKQLALVDPEGAKQKFLSTDWETLGIRESYMHAELANLDPVLALKHAEESGARISDRALLRAWAKTDPDAALAYANESSDPDITSLISGWPLDRIGELVPLADSRARQYIARRLAWPGSNLGIDWIQNLPDGDAKTEILDHYLYRRRTDPESIASLADIPIEQLEQFTRLDRLLTSNLEDRGEAWRTVLALPAETRSVLVDETALDELSFPWALDDSKAAMAALREFPAEHSEGKSGFAAGIARALGQSDPLGGLAEAANLPAQERDEFMEALGESWIDHDPDGFRAHLVSLADRETAEALRRGSFGPLAENSPREAIELIPLFDPADQAEKIGRVASSWSHSDPAAAAEFVVGLPQGEIRDDAASSLATTLAAIDPTMAADVLVEIGHREQREQGLFELFSEFADQNLPAARDLSRGLQVDDDTRAIIEAAIED